MVRVALVCWPDRVVGSRAEGFEMLWEVLVVEAVLLLGVEVMMAVVFDGFECGVWCRDLKRRWETAYLKYQY